MIAKTLRGNPSRVRMSVHRRGAYHQTGQFGASDTPRGYVLRWAGKGQFPLCRIVIPRHNGYRWVVRFRWSLFPAAAITLTKICEATIAHIAGGSPAGILSK